MKMEADFIRIASDPIGRKQWEEAESVLKEGLSKKPAGWAPIETSESEQLVHCWNQEEFIAYCGRVGKSGSDMITWVSLSYSQAFYLLAYIAVEEGNLQEAFEALRGGLQVEPDHPRLWCEMGHVLQLAQRREDALSCYQRAESVRAWATHSEKAQALRGKAINLIDLGRLDEAEQALQRSLEFEPGNAGALHERG